DRLAREFRRLQRRDVRDDVRHLSCHTPPQRGSWAHRLLVLAELFTFELLTEEGPRVVVTLGERPGEDGAKPPPAVALDEFGPPLAGVLRHRRGFYAAAPRS